MAKISIDPWGYFSVKDYDELIGQFGIEPFTDELLSKIPEPNKLMRRKVVFAHTDFGRVVDAIIQKKEFYALTGIMPTLEQIHLGTKLVIENMRFFQEHGAKTFVLVADLEAAATREVSLEESRQRALDFHIPAYIALGLDPKKTVFYFQSTNEKVKNLAFIFSNKVTLNEYRAIYGNTEPARMMSSILQAGDILFPQLEVRMPGVIPVGPDQSVHILLSRDIVNRTKSTFNFIPPSGLYNKFTPSLDGDLKMSKSKPQSCITIPDDINEACKKIRRALSGARKTLADHRKYGAIPEKDMCFQLLAQHFIEDDKELKRIYDEYKAGKMTTGEIKDITCEKLTEFMKDFERKFEKAKKIVPNLKFIQ
ncbi:MAG: tryptophan--tRNA ligase [Candidatus Aenigmarchaeota archaeon]|nr:tryptophan--tRNA ligase [Candidatus Aenigmarchaeota archaeon]